MAMSPDLSIELQKQPPQPPRFHPVPNRAMSPTKSSFRSPMKPKTPGRVVEFTSSTLSPLAQAQARAERRASASPEKEAAPSSQPQPMRFSSSPSSTGSNSNGNRSPTRGPPPASSSANANAKENEHDKENQWGEEELEQDEQEPVSYLPPSFSSQSFLSSNSAKPGPLSSSFLPPKPSGITAHHLPTPKPSSSTTSNSSITSNNENTNVNANPNPSYNKPAASKNSSYSNLATTTTTTADLPKKQQQTRQEPQKQPKQPLSQAQWTRDHWLRLDELLQARRKGTLQFQLTVRQGPAGNSIPTSGGKHHRLLGKQVTTASHSGENGEEESMILEAWHLDIVEAFRREVLLNGAGGDGRVNVKNNSLWTDEVLAKRLFALMVGEERRAAGRVDRAARRRRERELEREREKERRQREREREREEQTEEIRWY